MLYPRSIDGISPNSRTGSGRVRVVSMVAVRHSPISALGARDGAFCMSIGGADVRLFGEKSMLFCTIERIAIFAPDLIAYEPYHHIVCVVSPFFDTGHLDMDDA